MRRRANAYVTPNFQDNLSSIQTFHEERGDPESFEKLLDALSEVVVPRLERFPELGFDFFARRPPQKERLAQWARLKKSLGNAVGREYILDQHLILYAVEDDRLYLVAIRHHLQLSYDLKGHWGRP